MRFNTRLTISDMYPQGVWANTDSTNDPPFNVYNFGFWQYVDILQPARRREQLLLRPDRRAVPELLVGHGVRQ